MCLSRNSFAIRRPKAIRNFRIYLLSQLCSFRISETERSLGSGNACSFVNESCMYCLKRSSCPNTCNACNSTFRDSVMDFLDSVMDFRFSMISSGVIGNAFGNSLTAFFSTFRAHLQNSLAIGFRDFGITSKYRNSSFTKLVFLFSANRIDGVPSGYAINFSKFGGNFTRILYV